MVVDESVSSHVRHDAHTHTTPQSWMVVRASSSTVNSTSTTTFLLQAGLFNANIFLKTRSITPTIKNVTVDTAVSVCDGSDFFGAGSELDLPVDGSLCHVVRATRAFMISATILLAPAIFFRLRRRQHRIGAGLYLLAGEICCLRLCGRWCAKVAAFT